MILETSRFGQVEYGGEGIITFPEGILGFSKLNQYLLLEGTDRTVFLWLQSMKKVSVAFPLLEPEIFDKSYQVTLAEEDVAVLEVEKKTRLKALAIITIPTDPSKMTANLKAPLVINLDKNLAKQVILHDKDYPIRRPIFADLQYYSQQNQTTIFPEDENPAFRSIDLKAETTTQFEFI